MATVVIQKYTGKKKTSYSVKYKDPVTRKFRYFKTFPKKRDAQNAANDLRALIDSGKINEIKGRKKLKVYTFSEVTDLTIETWATKYKKEELSDSTYEGYVLRAEVLKRKLGKQLIREFMKDELVMLQINLKDLHSPANSNRYFFVLKQIFKTAMEVGGLTEDPASKIKYLSEKCHERNKFIMPDEIEKLIRASQKTRAKFYMPALIYLGAEHGTSKQEALSLQWADINFDFDDDGLIRFFRTKNKNERTEFLMPRTRQALLDWKKHLKWMRHRKKIRVKDTRFVFCRLDGTPISRFDKAWKHVCKIERIDNFHYHDLRHTFCSNLILSGSDLKDVKEIIGHKDLSMTDRYSHLTVHYKRSKQKDLAKHYESLN